MTRARNKALKLSQKYMNELLQEHDLIEEDLLFVISEKNHTTLDAFFQSFVKKHKSPRNFFSCLKMNVKNSC